MFKMSATISTFLCAQQFAFAGPTGTVLGDAEPLQWTVMTDASGAKVDYPAGIFTSEAGLPPRGTGRVLQSDIHEARFIMYVEDNETHQSPASFVKTNLTVPETQIDYRRITDRFFAVSAQRMDGRFTPDAIFPAIRKGASIASFCLTGAAKSDFGMTS
jgi:hypothetical protein